MYNCPYSVLPRCCSALRRTLIVCHIRFAHPLVGAEPFKKGSVYGAKAVDAIKEAFGWDNNVIYAALHVADTFTPEQIEAITQMRLPGGKPLSYSHVVALSQIDDDSQRQKLLAQTVREGWTTRRLANAVDKAEGSEPGKAAERRGRPLAKPKDFDAILDQQADFAQDFLNRNDKVWSHDGLSAKVDDMDPADFTQERADRLKRHAELLSLLAAKAKERAEEATTLRSVFVDVLKKQGGRDRKLPAQKSAIA